MGRQLTEGCRCYGLTGVTEEGYKQVQMAAEVEETLKRLVGHKGVIGTVVVNKEGACIKSTLDPSTTSQYSSILGSLISQAVVMFKELDPSNDVTFMRVRTKKCQFMVVPDNEYLFIVVQNNAD